MDIRNPRYDETAKVYDLWQICFNDPKPFADYLFSEVYVPANTICVFEGERLLAALQIYYHFAVFKGRRVKVAYIAGVSTDPNERNKGYCSMLMEEAEKRLKGENIDVITLIPFKFSFYEKYGYRCVSYLYYYHIKSGGLKKYAGTPSGAKEITEIYSNYIKRFDFAFERDEKAFSEIEGDVSISGGKTYNMDGGFMYLYPEKENIYVPEIVYENEGALFSMLSVLNEMETDIIIRSGVNLLPYFSETDIKIEVKPHLMVKELIPVGIEPGFENYINMLGWV